MEFSGRTLHWHSSLTAQTTQGPEELLLLLLLLLILSFTKEKHSAISLPRLHSQYHCTGHKMKFVPTFPWVLNEAHRAAGYISTCEDAHLLKGRSICHYGLKVETQNSMYCSDLQPQRASEHETCQDEDFM